MLGKSESLRLLPINSIWYTPCLGIMWVRNAVRLLSAIPDIKQKSGKISGFFDI